MYDRIGGSAAIAATVDQLYTRILDDATLAPFFAETDMQAQKSHQRVFLEVALGGKKADFDIVKYIETKHAKSMEAGLDETHFDAVAGHLVDSLVALDVPQDLVDETIGVVAPLRPIFEQGKN